MKTITLQRDYRGLKAGTEFNELYRYSDNSDIPMIRVARTDRKAIKTNVGLVLETSLPAILFEEQHERKVA